MYICIEQLRSIYFTYNILKIMQQVTIKSTGQRAFVKSTTTDDFDTSKFDFHLVDAEGETIWNGDYLRFPESLLIIDETKPTNNERDKV